MLDINYDCHYSCLPQCKPLSLRKITHSIWAGCIYRNVCDQSYNSKTFCSVFMKLGRIVKVWDLTIDNLDYGRHRVPILKSSM